MKESNIDNVSYDSVPLFLFSIYIFEIDVSS